MANNPLSDALLPVGATLRKVAEGDVFGDTTPTGADKAASAAAMQKARRNPSGIDMAAEAQKAAQRAGVGAKKSAPKQAAPKPASPVTPAAAPASSNGRDHYAPRASGGSFSGKILNND